MHALKLVMPFRLPESKEDHDQLSELENHERHLRRLIASEFKPIYIGDRVRVSERWASDEGKNRYQGKYGIVSDIQGGMQAAFNVDYLIYKISTKRMDFETYYYTLDLLEQTTSNKLLEKLLTGSNDKFVKFKHQKSKIFVA